MQSRLIKDPQVLAVLEESRDRIYSMALIHEQLYRSNDLGQVNLANYIRSLAESLFQSYRVGQRVQLSLSTSEYPLPLDIAIPCGLILNEMVSNALKHAFPEERAGALNISFYEADVDHLVLGVQDDGVGISEDLDLSQTTSLGLRLIRTLTRQLNGKLEIRRENGTYFLVTFPKRS